MTQINLATAKKLCTATEFRLVQASQPAQVKQHSAAALKKHTVQARRLRDKWRDQAQRQRRRAQQAKGARVTDDSARSAEKAELFAAVLARFEAATPSAQQTAAAAKPSKTKRSFGHRQVRASVRGALSEQAVAMRLKSKKKSLAAAAAAKKSPQQKEAATDQAAPAESGKSSTASASVPVAAKKKVVRKPSALPLAGSQRLGKQLKAQTAAKKSRIQRSGLTTRVRGHVSARGRRAQGRRDARG